MTFFGGFSTFNAESILHPRFVRPGVMKYDMMLMMMMMMMMKDEWTITNIRTKTYTTMTEVGLENAILPSEIDTALLP